MVLRVDGIHKQDLNLSIVGLVKKILFLVF